VAACGHGGQVLLSAATASLLEPGTVELADLGEHRLKDLSAPLRLYQLGHGKFPPLATLHRTNLPVPATPFLGRERELAEVAELLASEQTRVLTLTGPGGTGKTRLALQAAAATADRFPDGVTWLPLAPLRDPAAVLPALAGALGIPEEPGRPLPETLASVLAAKRALLLLDNCEHLLPALAADVARLRDLGGPIVLATSRERLQLDGEHAFGVPSLGADDAVELFLARASAVGVDLGRSRQVEELSERLDRLPLALELAAARTPLFSVGQLLARIGERLDLLRGSRDADPRQQTLRATIAWSYELLSEPERRLFRGLSVFATGCGYEAAEQVCGADPDTLQSLLDKSLMRRRDGRAGHRYWMLETVRVFAADELVRAGEADGVRRRHAEYLAALGDRLTAQAEIDRDDERLLALADELEDLRSAIAFAAALGDGELRLRLAGTYALAGSRVARLRDPREELEAALAAADDPPPALAAVAYERLGELSFQLGEMTRVREEGRRAAELYRGLGNERGRAGALLLLGPALVYTGERTEGKRLLAEAAAVLREHGATRGAIGAEVNLGSMLVYEGDVAGARQLFERGLAETRHDDQRQILLMNLAHCHLLQGSPARAAEL
jgi:predicted ATPase